MAMEENGARNKVLLNLVVCGCHLGEVLNQRSCRLELNCNGFDATDEYWMFLMLSQCEVLDGS